MNAYIDIHTHHTNPLITSSWGLRNILLHYQEVPINQFVSAGWHPWHIENHSLSEIEDRLLKAIQYNNVLAIGECGLDRLTPIPISSQEEVFLIHLKAAHKTSRPMIIHCVKSYSDLLNIFKQNSPEVPVILHGFNGNQKQVEQFLKYNTYFSFGEALFRQNQKLTGALDSVPLPRLFLETDDSATSIEKIYIRAGKLLNQPVESLKAQLYKNFITIFGDGLVKQD